MENVSFILNGREITAECEGRMTLLKYLRNVKCMKGSKEGCSTGHCGACSVLIDGILARSCVTVLKTLAGRNKLTDSIFRTDPKVLFMIFTDGKQDVRRKSVEH